MNRTGTKLSAIITLRKSDRDLANQSKGVTQGEVGVTAKSAINHAGTHGAEM